MSDYNEMEFRVLYRDVCVEREEKVLDDRRGGGGRVTNERTSSLVVLVLLYIYISCVCVCVCGVRNQSVCE